MYNKLCLCCLLAVVGCGTQGTVQDKQVVSPTSTSDPWFVDVTKAWGIDFVPQIDDLERFFMPHINGTGVAIFDYNRDGRLDLYFLAQGGPESKAKNRLYRQREAGGFEDVSPGSGLDLAGYFNGVAIGDFDNDGWPDVLVTRYLGVVLWRNRQDGSFEDVTKASGVQDPLWATSASFLDYDRDGWLDIFVTNYVDYDPSLRCNSDHGGQDYCGPKNFAGTASRLFRNRGRSSTESATPARADLAAVAPVTFEDVTVAAGIAGQVGPGLGVVTADFTGDGWLDIFVANDGVQNRLWVNQHNGTFDDEAVVRGVALNLRGEPEGNMGIALNDFDGDGLLDLLVTHLEFETHTLWKQKPRGFFLDHTTESRIAGPGMKGTGFGVIAEDFDHDGDVDVAIVNGRVRRGEPLDESRLGSHLSRFAARNHVFENDGHGKFKNGSPANPDFTMTPGVWRSLACGDLDGDGALDLVATAVGQTPRILRNVARSRGNWLLVSAVDPQTQRIAYGAEISLTVGERKFVRRVQTDGSFQSASSPQAHFGLGSATKIDAIHVVWPDGSREAFPGVDANQSLTLSKKAGTPMTTSEEPPAGG